MRAALEQGRWTLAPPLGYLDAPKWSSFRPFDQLAVSGLPHVATDEPLPRERFNRTAVTAPLSRYLEPNERAEESMASPRGMAPFRVTGVAARRAA
jgi:hypothetical protein